MHKKCVSHAVCCCVASTIKPLQRKHKMSAYYARKKIIPRAAMMHANLCGSVEMALTTACSWQ